MRLFSAVVPPGYVADSVEGELARLELSRQVDGSGPQGLRWVDRQLWHLTVAFYGDDDPHRRTEWLCARLAGLPSPRLRLAGAGTFPGVLWIGVADNGDLLRDVARAAGVDETARVYRPHLTLARWKSRSASSSARDAAARLAHYWGPSWIVDELVLMRSDPGSDGPRYTVVERFSLGRPDRAGGGQ